MIADGDVHALGQFAADAQPPAADLRGGSVTGKFSLWVRPVPTEQFRWPFWLGGCWSRPGSWLQSRARVLRKRLTHKEVFAGIPIGMLLAAVFVFETFGIAHTSATNAGLIISLTMVVTLRSLSPSCCAGGYLPRSSQPP